MLMLSFPCLMVTNGCRRVLVGVCTSYSTTLASTWQILRILQCLGTRGARQQPSWDRYTLTAPGTGIGGSVVLPAQRVGQVPLAALSRSLLPARRLPRWKWGISS